MMIPRFRLLVALSAVIVSQSWAMVSVAQQTNQNGQRRTATSSASKNQQQKAATSQAGRNQSQSSRSQARQPANTNRQAQRQLTPQQQRQRQMAQRQKGRPTRTAQRTAQQTPPRSSTESLNLAKPKVVEEIDPAKRAEFLKLVGANWIWSPAYAKDEVPVGDCYFRKTFSLKHAEFGQVHVACDNQYELYVNGRLAGQGNDWRKMNVHDVEKFLLPGTNVVAIKANNSDAGAAGLVARVVIKERGGTFESYSTDSTWRTSVKAPVDWMQPRMRDTEWLFARVYGPLGGVLPWGDEIVIADEGSRFLLDP
jgi:hypothetical protein